MGDTNLSTLVATTLTSAIVGNITGNATGQIVFPTVARTATATGATTGTIAAAGLIQLVTVTSGNADHIIILPAPTPGTIIILGEAGTGYELRSSDPATIAINGGSTADYESAIAADSMVFMVCTSATTWQGISTAGAVLAAVEAANDT